MACLSIDFKEKVDLSPWVVRRAFLFCSAVIALYVHHPTGFDFPAQVSRSPTRISIRWTWMFLLWKTTRKRLCWEISTPIICYLSTFYINARVCPLMKSLALPFARSVLWKTISFKVCDFMIKKQIIVSAFSYVFISSWGFKNEFSRVILTIYIISSKKGIIVSWQS